VSKRARHQVSGTEQSPPGAVLRVRTRLRTSPADEAVLSALGARFSSLQGKDLALRCSAGTGYDKEAWARRKQALTSECSSRWAGWATKSSNDAYALARANQLRALRDKQKAACVIEDKLRRTVHTTAERKELRKKEATAPKAAARRPRHLVFGYRSAAEHAMKRQRSQALSSEMATLKADI
jgi:hypothetical protein